MVSYKFTARRKQIYKLYAEGKDPRDIAKVVKLPSVRVWQIIKKIEEKIPKEELAKFHIKTPIK